MRGGGKNMLIGSTYTPLATIMSLEAADAPPLLCVYTRLTDTLAITLPLLLTLKWLF